MGSGDLEGYIEDSERGESHGVGVLLVGWVEECDEDPDEFGGGWGAVRSEDGRWRSERERGGGFGGGED